MKTCDNCMLTDETVKTVNVPLVILGHLTVLSGEFCPVCVHMMMDPTRHRFDEKGALYIDMSQKETP